MQIDTILHTQMQGRSAVVPCDGALGTNADDDKGGHNEDARQHSGCYSNHRGHLSPPAKQLPQVIGQAAQVHIQQGAYT